MISHHPDDVLLLSYANGSLDAASAIVVGAHLETCAQCRRTLQALDALGGDLIDGLTPRELQPGAFERVLARLASDVPDGGPAPRRPGARAGTTTARRPDAPAGMHWPRSLDGCDIGPWRRIGPGMRWTRVGVPEQPDANVVLLRMAAGRELAAHTHDGVELTQLLHGAFHDGRAVWRAGDLDQTDEHIHHHPVVTPDDECICLVALHGRVRFDGWVARRLGAWMGI